MPLREAADAVAAAAVKPARAAARVFLMGDNRLHRRGIETVLRPEFDVVHTMVSPLECVEQLPYVLPEPLKLINPRLAPFLRQREEERLRNEGKLDARTPTNAVVALTDHMTGFDFQRIRETVRAAGKSPLIWLRIDFQNYNPYATFRTDPQRLAHALEKGKRIKGVLTEMEKQGVLRSELLDDVVGWF